jgi:hypothetical protein
MDIQRLPGHEFEKNDYIRRHTGHEFEKNL